MTPFDLAALSEALPPGTAIVVSGGLLRIGNYTAADDADKFADPLAHWPSTVSSPEQMLAACYVTSLLQQKLGAAAYAAAVADETLPAWSPGEEIFE